MADTLYVDYITNYEKVIDFYADTSVSAGCFVLVLAAIPNVSAEYKGLINSSKRN